MVQPDYIEAEGKSVGEAIDKALKTLRVSRDKVDVKVLSEEKLGLFGMDGAKPARVRVQLKQ